MLNPLTNAQADIPPAFYATCFALAVVVFPGLFAGLSVLMFFRRIARPPYVVYFLICSSLGILCLGLCTETGPVNAVLLLYGLYLTPFILLGCYWYLRSRPERTWFHRTAIKASITGLAAIGALLLWTAWEEYLGKTPAVQWSWRNRPAARPRFYDETNA